MTQTLAILTRHGALQREIPTPDQPVVTGVRWGSVDEFPSPAYWLQLVLTQRLEQPIAPRRSTRTLAEEVGAWLLGGQGITAATALAAFERLRERGAFAREDLTEDELTAWLSEPLLIGGRPTLYRPAAQKAKYLAANLPALLRDGGALTGAALRNWLMTLSGLGPKTASGIVRQWSGADDIALLDAQLLRVGQLIGLFPRQLTVERHYLELEARFLRLCGSLGVSPVELESVISQDVGRSPETLRFMADHLRATDPQAPATGQNGQNGQSTKSAALPRARRLPPPEQLSLIFSA